MENFNYSTFEKVKSDIRFFTYLYLFCTISTVQIYIAAVDHRSPVAQMDFVHFHLYGKEPCLRMFFMLSFIKPALCFSLIVSRRAEHPDKHHQHPSM